MAESKVELVAEKKSGWLSGLSNLGSFALNTWTQYQTNKAQPATVAPAPAYLVGPETTTSTSSSTPRVRPIYVVGAVVLGVLLLRRR
jgi:hypothetical protein